MTDYEPQKNIERSLRIGFDGTCLSNRRGFGRFGRGILSGLAASNPGHLIEVVVDEPSSHLICVPPKVQLRLVKTREAQAEAASSRGNRSPMGLWKMSLGVREGRYDVFYFPTSFTFFPIWPGPKVIVTMHDTLAVDRPDLVFPTRRGRTFWWLKEQLGAIKCKSIDNCFRKVANRSVPILWDHQKPYRTIDRRGRASFSELGEQFGTASQVHFRLSNSRRFALLALCGRTEPS